LLSGKKEPNSQIMPANTPLDWSGLRDLLAFARKGSLDAAALSLGIDATTLARRLKRLEIEAGTVFTLHNGRRLELTAAGSKAVEVAEQMEQKIYDLSRHLSAVEPEAQGVVRLTSLRGILLHFILPELQDLRLRHPALMLDLIADARNLSLSRQEADIAIRLARPAGPDLIARKLADVPYAVFGAANAGWIAYDEQLSTVPEAQWVANHIPAHNIIMRTNAIEVVIDAVQSGIGQALLPVFSCPNLEAQTTTVLTREAWLVLHRDTRNTPRIRIVADWVATTFQKSERNKGLAATRQTSQ
jgi:DNA-binding transcriptional LysR family regulator